MAPELLKGGSNSKASDVSGEQREDILQSWHILAL
jgi:hypothetical protein